MKIKLRCLFLFFWLFQTAYAGSFFDCHQVSGPDGSSLQLLRVSLERRIANEVEWEGTIHGQERKHKVSWFNKNEWTESGPNQWWDVSWKRDHVADLYIIQKRPDGTYRGQFNIDDGVLFEIECLKI